MAEEMARRRERVTSKRDDGSGLLEPPKGVKWGDGGQESDDASSTSSGEFDPLAAGLGGSVSRYVTDFKVRMYV